MTPSNQPTASLLHTTKKQITTLLLALGVLLDLILLICRATPEGGSVWDMASLWIQGGSFVHIVCLGLVAMVICCTVLSGKALLSVLRFGEVASYPFVTGLILHLLMIVICSVTGVLDGVGVMLMVLFLVLVILHLII